LAARYFRMGADQGEPACQNSLAILHATGDGVPLDKVMAYALWTAALRKGEGQAERNRAHLRQGMTPAEIQRGEALSSTMK
jgi:TPR repeat protein